MVAAGEKVSETEIIVNTLCYKWRTADLEEITTSGPRLFEPVENLVTEPFQGLLVDAALELPQSLDCEGAVLPGQAPGLLQAWDVEDEG